MLRFLFWRILQCILVLWMVYTVTFWLLMSAPGNPFIGEKKPPQAVLEAMADKYGLELLKKTPDQQAQMSVGERTLEISHAYVAYLGRAVRGDFGPSIQYENWTVTEVIGASLPVSLSIGSFALLLATIGGVIVGTISGVFKGRPLDHLLTITTLLGISLPTFVIGAFLMMLLVVYVPILPSGGWGKPSQIILPSLTLALFYMAYVARLARLSVADTMKQDYVRTARAKGLPRLRVVTEHAGSNAMLPILSFLGPAAANILTGSFVVEKLFSIPGLGTHFVNGCLNKDIPLVLGSVMVYTAAIVGFSLIVDLAYAFVDPRVSLG